MNDVIKHKIKHNAHRTLVSIKWVIFAIIVGGIVGLCGTAFYFCLTFVTVLRGQDPWLLYLLPVGGLIIVGAYHLLHDEKDTGTNLVISAIHSDVFAFALSKFHRHLCILLPLNPLNIF